MILYWLLCIVIAAEAYLLGNLNTMVLASNFLFRTNLYKLGSGNLFLVNFRRIYGWKGALKLLLAEVIRDGLAIMIGALLLGIKNHSDAGKEFALFCLCLGRMWPAIYNFRGSSGLACVIVGGMFVKFSLGMAVGVVVLGLMYFTKYASISTFLGGFVLIMTAFLTLEGNLNLWLMVFIAFILMVKQIPNLSKTAREQEEKLSLKTDLNYKFDKKF